MDLPSVRKLRGYAFDPSLSIRLETHQINEITYEVPWEEIDYSDGTLRGEYVEIIDYDPSVKEFYETIDFNNQSILAENGLAPSESNPKFHQQMVYAVVMTTIKNFERALGRKMLWSTRKLDYDPQNGKSKYEEYIDRIRIYPHAIREANAYYSPQKKALLFGYFHSNPMDQKDQMPGTLVYTCLSHDIIAHETTHAILDGLQRHYNEPSNPDVLAFHEGFADLVALFQHFTFPDVLKHQIAVTRGDLSRQNLLGELAQQFGVAIGHYGSLRDAIGGINEETGEWEKNIPNPNEYNEVMEPHHRGGILVAAVFDAFLAIYERRVADLNRIASNGTGILPQGELHPDLVNRLATEASKTAQHVLYMCIRAIDYCPPTDITFGEYLRAIITADCDLVSSDPYAYRLAFMEAFKKRGIYPQGIVSLSIESLWYPKISIPEGPNSMIEIIANFLRDYSHKVAYYTNRKDIYEITKGIISGNISLELRKKMLLQPDEYVMSLHRRINVKFNKSNDFIKMTGLMFGNIGENFGIRTSSSNGASFSVQNLRLVNRVGPNGNKVNQVVFSIIQKSGVIIKDDKVLRTFIPDRNVDLTLEKMEKAFIYRGGCTLILDLDSRKLKYSIKKPLLVFRLKNRNQGNPLLNKEAIEKQWLFQNETSVNAMSEFQKYFSATINDHAFEPFALLHQH
ncbi:gluzincin family metallopeptidase [Kriegella aquimaris]|uniref:Peptidase M4 n=1 Tax=Kriegella aquimaris TaxID=192904 RepID=A0A1G9RE46_9FLAO|nr:hypothetical protein [Kriegella aquimaris]SDM21127.1 hypothetical protein SAMN04488514_10687 [Kriegella aquimaris]